MALIAAGLSEVPEANSSEAVWWKRNTLLINLGAPGVMLELVALFGIMPPCVSEEKGGLYIVLNPLGTEHAVICLVDNILAKITIEKDKKTYEDLATKRSIGNKIKSSCRFSSFPMFFMHKVSLFL